MFSPRFNAQRGIEHSSEAEESFSWRRVLEPRHCSALKTSYIGGRFSGITEVQHRAISRAPKISCLEEFEILGSRTWDSPLVMLIFLLTHLTTSRDSTDSVSSICSAGRPVTSSSKITPKLYVSICSVAFLVYPHSANSTIEI